MGIGTEVGDIPQYGENKYFAINTWKTSVRVESTTNYPENGLQWKEPLVHSYLPRLWCEKRDIKRT